MINTTLNNFLGVAIHLVEIIVWNSGALTKTLLKTRNDLLNVCLLH